VTVCHEMWYVRPVIRGCSTFIALLHFLDKVVGWTSDSPSFVHRQGPHLSVFLSVHTSCAAHPLRISDQGVLEGLSASVKSAIHSQFD
jgi:hypothetical protein